MDNILEIKGLTKRYKDFVLDNVTLTLPRGMVMGLVGANGAGKTTMLKLLLGLARPDSGEVTLLDGNAQESTLHEKIGVVFDELTLPGVITPLQAGRVMAGIYKNWDDAFYKAMIMRLELPEKKENKSFSRGMKMKLAIALAMSHNSELLLLDEPTGGLDPLVRAEVLDILREFMQDERHSILISSHITSDLERIADFIAYIDRGHIIMTEEKDVLLEEYGVVRGRGGDLEGLKGTELIGLQNETHGFEALVRDRNAMAAEHPGLVCDRARLDDIMSFVVREARK